MGEGKLFVHPAKGNLASTQKALWLCSVCVEQFELRYDRCQEEFHLVRRKHAA